MPQNFASYAFQGGLDTNSAALAVSPGAVISAMNYEPLSSGYGRVQGFERFDGRTAPSAADWWLLAFDAGSSIIAQGDVINGATSGATAVVIEPPISFTGAWPSGNAAGVLLLIGLTGTFLNDEVLRVGTTAKATVNGVAQRNSAATEALITQYTELAQAWQRALISRPPGEGPARGVAVHNRQVFGFRDVEGGAYCQCYRATAAGWVEVPSLSRMNFTASSLVAEPGQTINGATSGATAKVINSIQTSGDVATGTAAGYLHLQILTGTFSASEAIRVGVTPVGTATAPTVMRIAAGGRVRGISHNFYGASNLFRYYGANGTGPAFEITAEGIATISTGMADDRPQRVFEIGNHLGLTFPGGSIQFSGTGEPHGWQVVLGAAEIGFGTEVTDVVQANETAVAIFGEQKVAVLQGNDVENFLLDTLTTEAGADPDTAQRIARTVYVDARGLRDLTATQNFGNFSTGSLSGQFSRYFTAKRRSGAKPIGSFVSRRKSQYRLVWDDGTGLAVYMGGKRPEALPFEFDDMRPFCFGQGELDDGEGIFVGAEDGYIYRLDSGTNFDGNRIRAFVMTPFNHFGNPALEERFHWVALELDTPARANIGITVQFDYAEGHQPIAGEREFEVISGSSGNNSFLVQGGGGNWDADVWNDFYWSAPVEGTAKTTIDGMGRNASFVFATYAALTEEPHVLQAYTVSRSPRKMRRI